MLHCVQEQPVAERFEPMRVVLIAFAAATTACSSPEAVSVVGVQTGQSSVMGPPGGSREPLPVATMAGIAYADQSASQRMNLYLPQGEGPFPLVIMIHGGAFMFGDHNDAGPGFKTDVDALNADGMAVASIGYRLSGEATFPAAVQDVKTAIRHLRTNAVAYRIDPARFALWGKSAGGNLALLGGLARGVALFENPQLDDSSVDDSVKAIVAFYPPVNFLLLDTHAQARGCQQGSGPIGGPHDSADSPESRYLGGKLQQRVTEAALANPITYLGPDSPPIYLAAGSADCTVAPDQSILFFDAMRTESRAAASTSELHVIDGATHADPVFDQGENLRRVRAFLNRHLQ